MKNEIINVLSLIIIVWFIVDVLSYCMVYKIVILLDFKICVKYFNCFDYGGVYVECWYLDLYFIKEKKCVNFIFVKCDFWLEF